VGLMIYLNFSPALTNAVIHWGKRQSVRF
jgi:hypothetical protein